MAEDAGKQQPPSLDEFSKRLDAARGAGTDKKAAPQRTGVATGKAFRLSSELLAALIVGVALGWGLDRLFGLSPWGLLAGLFLGFAAGVVNVSRAMKDTGREDESGGPSEDG